jgi:hypothetical protein
MTKRLLSSVCRVAIVVGCWSVSPAAQESTGTVMTVAPIYVVADAKRTPLRTAAVGTSLRVLEDNGEWLRVEFQDPQFGRRVGYVIATNVRVSQPNQQPMDLSITPAPGAPRQPAAAALDEQAPVQPRRPRPSTITPRVARGWVDVNFGMANAGQQDYSSAYDFTVFRETARFQADYHLPVGAEFDFGGGFMFTPTVGLGVSCAGTAHQDKTALSIRIPHPMFANTFAADTGRTESKQMRSEGSANIQLVVAQTVGHTAVRLYGGPSFFRVQQDAVEDIIYDQAFLFFSPVNAVNITGFNGEQIAYADATGWGFHVGGDVSWFFTRIVGVGGFAKFSRGTVNIIEPLSGDDTATA